jgi:two-component system OmpR family response regulator
VRELPTAVIAEDHADTRALIELVLTQCGFRVVHAEDGPTAIAAVHEHAPLLTTLDVNMPGMDGFAVAKRLREFSQTYLIMITSLDSEIDVVRGLEAGADDYLVKPFRPRELRARADAMLRRTAFAAANAVAAPAPVQEDSWVATARREFEESLDGREPALAVPAAPAPVRVPAPVAAAAPGRRMASPAPAASMPPAAPGRRVAAAPVTTSAAEDNPVLVQGDVFRLGDLMVDSRTGAASVGGRGLTLTQPETQILLSLLRTGRRVRSKADLVLAVRGQEFVTSHFVNEADKKAVEGYVASLRGKIGDDESAPRYIETVRGVGFRLAS